MALGLSLASSTVWAHARFVESTPAADSVLQQAPREIILSFSQAVTPVSVTLLGPNGEAVDMRGEATANDARVIVAVPERLAPGNYEVGFTALSGDAHAITGSFRFSIAALDPGEHAETGIILEAPQADSLPAKPRVPVDSVTCRDWFDFVEKAGRAAFVLTLLMAVGMVLFRVLVPLPEALDNWVITQIRGIGSVGLGVTVVYFSVATIGVTGLEAFRPRHAYILLQTSIGVSLILASIGFLFLTKATLAHRILMGNAAALLLVSRVVTGHPVSQEPAFLLVPGMAIHVAAAAFWFAALWVLLRMLRKGPPADTPRILDRFSRVALWSVGSLLAAGVLMAAVHLRSIDALLATDYGNILLWKLLGVTGLLVFASLNRFWLTSRLAVRYDPGPLKRSIQFEVLLMLAVIAVSTILAATPPSTKASERDAASRGRLEQQLHSSTAIPSLASFPGSSRSGSGSPVASAAHPGQ